MNLKRIISLVSTAKHPVSGTPRHCQNDSIAMGLGLTIAKSATAHMEVVHAGSADDPALLDYLAFGAEKINVIPADGNTDIAMLLAENLVNADLILTGSRAESGLDSGLLPYMLASKLNIPIVANALEIKQISSGIEILQFLPKGKRKLVAVSLPAIVTVHPLAPVALNYAYAKKSIGKINVHSNNSKHPNASNLGWQTQAPMRKPIKLKASETKTGHERLQSAITTEGRNGTVVNDGNNVEKAQVILRYLREHRLINF
jgi:electron transfer flavoprotein beta subunit